MKSLMGVVNLDHDQDLLHELTYFRSVAGVPFGGRYRMIDFVLSNMVNSGIQDIAVFARNKYRSLMDHLGTGAPWDLNRKRGGLFILPPDWNDPTDISKGDLRHFHNHRDFFHRGNADHVLVSGSQFISKVDYEDAFKRHQETKADVTVLYKKVDQLEPEDRYRMKLEFDSFGNVKSITNDEMNPNLYMQMYIIRKDLLLELLNHCIGYHKQDLFVDGIMSNLNELAIRAYEYKGYLSIISSVASYYKHSMNLLKPEIYQSLFLAGSPIYTKIKDEPPAKYVNGSEVSNSLVANGCVIEGHVENSILFRGVYVAKGVSIKNSIIMQRCYIHEDTHLDHVILDKDILISPNRQFAGAPEQPFVIAKRKAM
ncbi:glucose-1-phosphate adenylyltransferase subunit GlgD [Halalkalibacterium halodurans]|uniref:Glucose-1-phosphate adenylyltransferase subunit GlgD n=1 Tax=Halalkalibacterium halodurans TaxID=86665 RepID=A0A0M0KLX9_ALKHA|nr:glucose-1-phosphate adenylyltransferase subunit GlgD [Halalkalibacterium halodurans]MED4161391.1 glucose-1-phosphate adenylyltransferase subunit GlgD [Halalkalibacterium halodurans]TPE70741.1 glucose-1-phosphate adenylyltransferase subunit GlgD [Halalkalibacterium halodurans]